MDIDKAFDVVGHFGRHQKWLLFCTQSSVLYVAFHMLMLVFMTQPEPNDELYPLRCTPIKPIKPNQTVCSVECENYIYPAGYPNNIVSEWDLVCDRRYLVAVSVSCVMAGVLVGSIVCGILSDMFGRRLTIICSIFTLLSMTFFTVLVTNYTLFLALRFIIGVANAGLGITITVLGTEIVGPAYRSVAVFSGSAAFIVGMVILSVVGYLQQTWRSYILTLNLIGLPFVFLYWVIPESPRWLYTHGYVDEAENVLYKFAVKNCRKVMREEITLARKTPAEEDSSRKKRYSPLDLLRIQTLRKRTIIMGVIWMITSLVYYGISMSVSSLKGNMYLIFALLAVAEIPSMFGVFFIERYGRRLVLMICYAIAGAACIFVPYIPVNSDGKNQYIQICFALVGKLCIATAFNIIYVYVSELYPTVVRNNAVGSCSMCARVGGILAPFVAQLGSWWKAAPYMMFGVTGMIAAALTSFLPETLNQPVPETMSGLTDADGPFKYTELKQDDEILNNTELELNDGDLDQIIDEKTDDFDRR